MTYILLHDESSNERSMRDVPVDKQERINLRLTAQAKQTLEHAASVEGKTLSKFILSCALAHANETIHEHEVMQLSRQTAEAFFDALSRPVSFNNKLTAALEEHDERVISK